MLASAGFTFSDTLSREFSGPRGQDFTLAGPLRRRHRRPGRAYPSGVPEEPRPAPASFWERPWSPTAAASMAAKYTALGAAESAPAGAQGHLLRAAAARWPGSLRESQLTAPALARARHDAARRGARSPASTRAAWDAAGEAALPLWADLHDLLHDLAEFRQRATRDRASDPAHLHAFVARDPARADRWPATLALLVHLAGPRVGARQAHLWLAARAGVTIADLGRVLFGRVGHWDARPGDPPQARSYPLISLGFPP